MERIRNTFKAFKEWELRKKEGLRRRMALVEKEATWRGTETETKQTWNKNRQNAVR